MKVGWSVIRIEWGTDLVGGRCKARVLEGLCVDGRVGEGRITLLRRRLVRVEAGMRRGGELRLESCGLKSERFLRGWG